ncbi:MAG TPA: FTR1 family protein [Candidatus Thermoplasmatota archaeon]|nr:FTR1 family protein [Candidatus Thermoplasmatota archaeon]
MEFVAEAALIALREGLEALLITGILLGLVTKLGRPDARKHVWFGFAAAVLVSLVAGYLVQAYLLEAFEAHGGAEIFELVAALSAVVVLTYMVFWMWKHTRELLTTVRAQVAAALTAGTLGTIVFLTFASVIREGLEVVLFYGALVSRSSPFDLAWSGLLGFLLSAAIVWAILRGTAKVDLQKFFAITGILLVFVAAGLIVHSVEAATALGLLQPQQAIWDMTGVLTDDSALGRVLHATLGYTAMPTLLQALLYFAYVFGVGGAYLWGLGLFHRRATGNRAPARSRLVAAGLAVLLVLAAIGAGAANPKGFPEHAHGATDDHHVTPAAATVPLDALGAEGKFGVLLRSHGEPIHYNETTYRSFADFVKNLLTVLGFQNLLLVDQGTVLLDKAHPFEKGPRVDADLMDAWTHPYAGPALYVGSPVPGVKESQLPFFDGFYVAPGGPGLGEPDILEMAGLSAYIEWLQMNGTSPMHWSKMLVLDAAERQLKERYGDRVVVQKSYHILPKVGPGESDAEAAKAFKEAGVSFVVDAYTSAIFSDVMNTCMMQPHLLHAFTEAGYTGKLVHAKPSGITYNYSHAVARRIEAAVKEVPAGAQVAVFLTHHGANPDAESPCAPGTPDQYNANAASLYEAILKALEKHPLGENVRLYQVYGQGAGSPDDGILSPLEAVDAAKQEGATLVLDLPYELTGNGFDNLVAHRGSYGLDPAKAPHYDGNHETYLTVKGVTVRILSSSYEAEARGRALVEVVEEALRGALKAPSA